MAEIEDRAGPLSISSKVEAMLWVLAAMIQHLVCDKGRRINFMSTRIGRNLFDAL
jgi:hypothetical protein